MHVMKHYIYILVLQTNVNFIRQKMYVKQKMYNSLRLITN